MKNLYKQLAFVTGFCCLLFVGISILLNYYGFTWRAAACSFFAGISFMSSLGNFIALSQSSSKSDEDEEDEKPKRKIRIAIPEAPDELDDKKQSYRHLSP